MSKKHLDFLSNHCRVCSKVLGKSKYSCSKYTQVLSLLGVDIGSDNSHIHPENFCNSCYMTAKRITKSEGQPSSQTVTEWLPHDDTFCFVCDVHCKGGRPRKTSSGGRPTKLQQNIRTVALKFPTFKLSQVVDESWKTHITCTSCRLAANNPVQIIPCRSLLCSSCTSGLISQATFECPGCSSQHISSSSTFTNLSSLEEKMFRDLMVKCEKCNGTVKLEHTENDCAHHHSDSMTLRDVLNQPLEEEPSKLEKRAAIKVVSRILHQNESTTCTLSTGGRVRTRIKIENTKKFINFHILCSQSV